MRFVMALWIALIVTAMTGLPSRAAELQVEFETMTWPEVKAALAAGRTTALIYTGGTEQRGPQNANGGHNLMGKATVKAIALKLGNAIFMPVLPFSPNQANAALPGTIGLTNELLGAVLERVADQTIINGFKNIILMGDHGGGQPDVYVAVAKSLNDKYAGKGIRVFYCDDVYKKAHDDFNDRLVAEGYPSSYHAGITDTSLMMYLDGNDGVWVRKDLVASALGDPPPGSDSTGKPRVNNGITGDARRSSAEIGKRLLDLKVDYAVKQIRSFTQSASAQ